MKNIRLLFLVFLFFPDLFYPNTTCGNNRWNQRIDSLKKVYPLKESDSTRADVLNDIGSSYIETGYYDTAFIYIWKAIHLAEKTNYKKKLGIYYSNLGNIFYYKGEYDTSLAYQFKGLKLKEKYGDIYDLAVSFQNIGLVYEFWGQYKKALEYYLQSLKNAEDCGDSNFIATGMMNIGLIYESLENYTPALEYIEKGESMSRLIGNDRGIALCLMNKGNIYKKQEQYDTSLLCFEQAFTLMEKSGDRYSVLHCYNNAGEVYKYTGRYEKAIEYYTKALNGLLSMNEKFGTSACYHNLGETYSLMGEYLKAHEYFDQSLAITKEINFRDLEQETYKIKAETYSKQKDFKNAYEYFRTYSSIKDSMLNEQTSKQITEMQTKYETEKKEKEILLLKKDQEIQHSEAQRQKIIRNSFIGASVLALLLALVLLNRYQIKKKANQKLTEQNEQIRKQKELIEEQKQNMTDSIEYASYIQKVVLPSDAEFKEAFPDSFILFRPRDIVSGDFYYLTILATPSVAPRPPKEGEPALKAPLVISPPLEDRGAETPHLGGRGAIIALGDCTGHGVPGAFMSMLCNALLNEAVNDKGLTKPNEILDDVRKGIISALKQREGGGGSKDGMDCSLINVETPNLGVSTLKIACANNPVYIVKQGVLTEIKPDRQPVGFSYNPIPFTTHEIELSARGGPRRIAGQKGDMIYLMSDGYEDQMGGEKEKKFKNKRLKELLISISDKSTGEQKNILEKTFEEWKSKREQTDDVTVIGIRV